MKYNIFIIFFFLLSKTIFAQNGMLSSERLKADANFYFKILYEQHPNPYYYFSLNEFEDKKNEIYSHLSHPLTHEEFAWVVGRINSCLDMHSMINVYFQTHWRKDPLTYKGLSLFPNVKIKKDKLYLKSSNKEIKIINGVNVKEIISDIKQYFNWKLPNESNWHAMEVCFDNFLRNKYSISPPFRIKYADSNKVY